MTKVSPWQRKMHSCQILEFNRSTAEQHQVKTGKRVDSVQRRIKKPLFEKLFSVSFPVSSETVNGCDVET